MLTRRTLLAAALIACAAHAQEAPPQPVRDGQRIDDRRPDEPLTVDLFGRPVQLTGSWELTAERRRNFDLNPARDRDRRVREHEIKLEARTRPARNVEVFVQAVGLHDTRRTNGTPGRQVTKSLERGQTWVRFEGLAGTAWDLQAGRVALIDRRAFWWDDDVDAVRALYNGNAFRLDTGLARTLLRVSSADSGIRADERGVLRWFGHAEWRWAPRQRLDAFWLHQDDRSPRPAAGTRFANEDATDPSDLRATWAGLRASGEWRSASGWRVGYRGDLAWLRGREALTAFDEQADGSFSAQGTANRRVRGHAHDVGATLVAPWPLRPSLSVGHARGSEGFRQTGLHENKARVVGAKRVQMYGELLQPELANLQVTSLGAGLRFLDNSSLELLQHRYRQPVPADSIAGSRLSTDPEGSHGEIGDETDLVLAWREWKAFELTVRLSRFKPGAAFAPDRRAPANAVEVGAALNF